MKKVYVCHDPLLSGFLRGVLDSNNIQCLVKNESLMGASGEIPAHETWPEIWVMDDQESALAKKLIDHALQPEKNLQDWQCAQCGENIEAQFTHCWQCAAARPE